MRSPVIAFGIFAAAAVTPSLVGAAPTSPNVLAAEPHPASAVDKTHFRRVEDYRTAGGNAYSGATGNVSGGNAVNDAGNDDNAITNMGTSSTFLGDID